MSVHDDEGQQFDPALVKKREGYDDGIAGVVERSAREHARELLNMHGPDAPSIAAAYLTGYWYGGKKRHAPVYP